MKKIIFLLLVLSCAFYSTAQDFQLGKVTLEELQERQHPKDTAAAAAVLFKNGKNDTLFFLNKRNLYFIP